MSSCRVGSLHGKRHRLGKHTGAGNSMTSMRNCNFLFLLERRIQDRKRGRHTGEKVRGGILGEGQQEESRMPCWNTWRLMLVSRTTYFKVERVVFAEKKKNDPWF